MIAVVELMIEPQVAKPSAIVANEKAGGHGRSHRRRPVLPAEFTGSGKLRAPAAAERSGKSHRGLSQRIAGDLVSTRRVVRRKTGKSSRGCFRPPEFQN